MDHLLTVYHTKPKWFTPSIEIAGCYLELDSRLLLLQLAPSKPEAGKWGVPAGKAEPGEPLHETAVRELFEETGISVESSSVHPIGPLYIEKPHIQYVFHLFKIDLAEKPPVKLSKEHTQFLWASPKDLLELPLMAGAKEALDKYRLFKKTNRRSDF